MEEQSTATVAPFPTPPPFYQHFTKHNVARMRQLRAEAASQSRPDSTENTTKPDVDILSLPAELRYLVPPNPPQDGRYRSFGASFDLQAPPETLASQGIEQLYPPNSSVKLNPQPHLVSLTRSLLTTFLSLIGILSKNPELFESKVEDLQTMLYNMHELINEYRPHQARESLIMIMEERVERLREETRKIGESKEKVDKLSRELAEQGERADEKEHVAASNDEAVKSPTDGKWKHRQRQAWQALNTALAEDE